jgi:glycine cleavage system aminomethyltransferase T
MNTELAITRLSTSNLSITRRTRATPFTSRVEAAGVHAYTIYNHTLLAANFRGMEADYWHLCEHVQVWDVAAEKQVAISGPDAYHLIQLMTPALVAVFIYHCAIPKVAWLMIQLLSN